MDEPETPESVHLAVPVMAPRELHIVLTYSTEAMTAAAFHQFQERMGRGDGLRIELHSRGTAGHA